MRFYERKLYNRLKEERADEWNQTSFQLEAKEKAARIEQYAAQIEDRKKRLSRRRDESWQEGETKDELTYFAPADQVAKKGSE